MENLTITGKVYRIDATIQISDKFKKREFIVETIGDHPQNLLIQVTNDKCSILDNVRVGDTIKVSINLRGRLWNDPKTGNERCFNTIDAWNVQLASPQTGSFAQPSPPPMPNPSNDASMMAQMAKKDAQTSIIDDVDDDLPF